MVTQPLDFNVKLAAWMRFVETDEIDLSVISQEVGDSWRRCRQYGLDPYGAREPIRLSPQEISERQQRNKVVLDAAGLHPL